MGMTDLISDVARDLWELHHRFIARSGNKAGSIEDERFLALALAGEAGEVANFVKKQWRGDQVDRESLKDELSDVFVYWCLLVRCAGFDAAGVISRSHTKAVEKIAQLEGRR
jgi:NTP pyrophosphatase (non-canonical NTP hydrolase)